MADTQAFLVEIGTEELPPRSLKRLALAFLEQFNALVRVQSLQDGDAALENEVFFSPRRLAIHAPALRSRQPDRREHRLGPAVQAAFDPGGQPTKAAQGFAKSCGVAVDQLGRQQTDKGERLAYTHQLKGKTAAELLPPIVNEALAKLPIAKRMRWGDGDVEFVRPVHWVVMRLGARTLKAKVLGVTAGNKTYGHRYHHPAALALEHPADYRELLATTGKVLVEDRSGTLAKKIHALVNRSAKQAGGRIHSDAALVEEIAALVEWPVPVTGNFDKRFLVLPGEVIQAVLETQQRYFPLRDAQGKLLPKFIAISNIRSKQPVEVRRGNERVIVPRLSDAMFFWDKDRSQKLATRLPELERVVFQKELGSYGDKSRRVAELARKIAGELGHDPQLAARAGQLCKCDLVTGMVGEFPELQGIMGGYYARHDGEPEEVTRAIGEHYLPRHAGDTVPRTAAGQALALADKLDTLAGIFSIGEKPTGDKDPFGLRRAGLGLMRILVEQQLDLDLVRLIRDALAAQPCARNHAAVADDLYEFLLERLRAYYLDTGIRADVFEAVRIRRPPRPLDFQRRVQAVNEFLKLPEAASLAAANRRISNILKQAGQINTRPVEPARLHEAAEQFLHTQIEQLQESIQPLLADGDYASALKKLAALRQPVDEFFERVLVMDPDVEVRANRLALLHRLSSLFLYTADLTLIQTE